MSSALMGVLTTITFLLISVLLIFHFKLCCSQDFVKNVNCDEGGCDVTTCIERYSQLDSYILNNKTLLEIFSKTFFKTGEDASQFVRLIYKFQVSDNLDGDSINCTSHTATYIWSTSVLSLLGPEPLRYLTLFAVRITEVDSTIELPCFCSEAYRAYLARLTYLVCYIW